MTEVGVVDQRQTPISFSVMRGIFDILIEMEKKMC